jgi:hypothetical protein
MGGGKTLLNGYGRPCTSVRLSRLSGSGKSPVRERERAQEDLLEQERDMGSFTVVARMRARGKFLFLCRGL